MAYRIICDEILRWAESYNGPLFHAVLCDPPYELAFMGKSWDKTGVAFRPETWAALVRCLHPGGFIMAFASGRGFHRVMVAMEDAGLELHHSLFAWLQGQGFPKATRIDSQVPATPLADVWAGHRYGQQSLKPAIEPIILAQRPYEGRPVDNITDSGAGALWIDGGRISGAWQRSTPWKNDIRGGHYCSSAGRDTIEFEPQANHPAGRWPSNVILSHLPDCKHVGTKSVGRGDVKKVVRPRGESWRSLEGRTDRLGQVAAIDNYGAETVGIWDCAPGCPVAALGEQSGELKSGTGAIKNATGVGHRGNVYGAESRQTGTPNIEYGDTGTAARFYYQADWSLDVYEQLESADTVRYVPKVSARERNVGLDALPLQTRNRVNPGGLENEPRWAPTKVRNPHPTLKPITLIKYLSTLLLPPDAYAPRRILVPFAGAGSEMIGAMQAGFEEIVGIELKEEYCEIGRARMAWWAEQMRWGLKDVDAILSVQERGPEGLEDTQAQQLELFS